jgi:acetolactate synthase-1/2/3 large subunit
VLEDALNTAYNGRPGPVHIAVPKDVTVMKVDNFRQVDIAVRPVVPVEKAVGDFVSVLSEGLKSGRKILLLIGYGCIRSHAGQLLRQFVDRFQIPFATTMDAKGLLPENHPLSLGVYGSSGDPGANKYFDSCDVLLAVGNSFAQNATFAFKPDLLKNKKLLHVNIDPNEINKVYKADVGMVADAKLAVEALTKALSGLVSAAKPLSLVREKYYDIPLAEKTNHIHPADMVRALSRNLPENAIVMGDAGSHMLWLNCYMSLDKNQRYQNPGSFGPMASHTNGAIGVKCANPDKVVISGSGDGCFLMAGFELLTCVENNIPVIWVIFRNGEFNVIKKFLINMYNQHAFMQFRNPDFMMYAKACGADGYRVEKLEDFEPALRSAIKANRPALIDVVVDSEVYPPFNLAKV